MSDLWGRHVILRDELHKENPKSKRHICAASEEEYPIMSLQELEMHPMTGDFKKKMRASGQGLTLEHEK